MDEFMKNALIAGRLFRRYGYTKKEIHLLLHGLRQGWIWGRYWLIKELKNEEMH